MAGETELIRKIDVFTGLDEKIINKIAEVCIDREFSAGEYIIKQGETGLGLFFITSGKVKVEVEKNGTKTVVAELKEEDFIGELSIIDSKPRSASVICLADTRCLLLTRDSFMKLMNKYPEIAVHMAKALAERLRETTEKMTQRGSSSPTVSPAATSTPTASGTAAGGAAVQSASTSEAKEPAGGANGASTKDRVKDFLVKTFSRFYTLKAMARFSAAVIGCPVRVNDDNLDSSLALATVGEVKIAVFPSSRERVLKLSAFADGKFTAAVLRPMKNSPRGFVLDRCEGHLKEKQSVALHIPRKSNRSISLQRPTS